MSHPGRRALLALVALLAAVSPPLTGGRTPRAAAATTTTTTSPDQSAAQDVAGAPRLTLASQTPWVTAGGEFDVRFAVHPAGVNGGRIVMTIFGSIPNRSEFKRTIDHRIDESVIAQPLAVPLDSLVPDAAGARDIRIPLQPTGKARDRSKLLLSHSGVYPVRIEYRPDGGGTPAVLVTHLLFFAGPISGDKLKVTWIVPIHSPPSVGPNATDVITDDQSNALAQLASALDSHQDIPVVLSPTPDTLSALAASARDQDKSTLRSFARPQPNRQVVTGTYVPVSLPGMLSAGLADDATLQLTRGSDTLAATLDIRPDGRTWVEQGPMDQAAAAFLRGTQVDRIVLPDASLSPSPFAVTLAQPFELNVRPAARIQAAAADGGLAAHFLDPDPVLGAHQLLADLAVLYLDRPGQSRGVVADTPRSWVPDPAFLSTFLDGLAASPVVAGATLDTLFSDVPAATRGGLPLARTLLTDPRVAADAAGLPTEAIRSAHRRVENFGSALSEDNPLISQLQDLLLTSESADLADNRSRLNQLDDVNQRINQQLGLIQLPSKRKITLTARTGRLPISILSNVDYPVRVVVRVESDKLQFPGFAPSTAVVAETEDLRKGNNAVDFTVRARTTGSFPLHISLMSPDGGMVLASTTFTVQSTALSGVGLVLSVGAALFLALWWGRQIIRDRRARRAAPAP
jgi:uncharacterized protein DUF6049